MILVVATLNENADTRALLELVSDLAESIFSENIDDQEAGEIIDKPVRRRTRCWCAGRRRWRRPPVLRNHRRRCRGISV